MTVIADILMGLGAFGAALYCLILSNRLKKFTTLESGMGSAIAVLSAQVDDMTRALEKARATAAHSSSNLEELTDRAEAVAGRIELLLASMHDLSEERPTAAPPEPALAEEGERRLRFVRRRAAGGRAEPDLEAAE